MCMDISRGWMEVARKTLHHYKNIHYYQGRISDSGLPETMFDVVIIHFVLHDIPADERLDVFKALVYRLKPGGSIRLREPHGQCLTLAELKQFAKETALSTESLRSRKTIIGNVYDGYFKV